MKETTLAILAGGAGSRMGKPKGELRVADAPILSYLLDRFAWPGATMLVTAPGREHPPGWERFTTEVTDPVSGQGPLRGVLTALENASTPVVLVTTVDMPEVSSDQFRWLVEKLDEHRDAIGLMTSASGRFEPFPSIFRTTAAAGIRSRLISGQSSVHQVGAVVLPAPDHWDWTNLNDPTDLEAFFKRRSSGE